jgi:hypothetical protein
VHASGGSYQVKIPAASAAIITFAR